MAKAGGRSESEPFEKTQEYLARLLGYLESLYTSMDWESRTGAAGAEAAEARETGASGGLPPRLARVLADSGYLEGMSLKAQGALSSDLQEFIQGIGYAFEVDATPNGVFKLPFVDNEIAIQRKTLNGFMEKAWLIYHAALLSAYALKPLRFERLASGAGAMEETVRVIEAKPGEDMPGPGAETVHAVNNSLAGIISYVSLVMAEKPGDADLQHKLGMVLEAAKRAGEAIKKK